jgi:hypothetical protein
MKKLMTALLVFGASFAGNAQAASKSDIWNLLQHIDNELRYYDQSSSALDRAQEKLQEALAELRGMPGGSPQECLDYIFNEYRKDGYSNSISMERSKDFCAQMNATPVTMGVLRFFYENLRSDGYAVSIALNQAMEMARNVGESQLPCLRSAFDRYRGDGYGARIALQMSVDYCRR